MPGGVGDIWDRDVGILVLALVRLQVRENLLPSWVDIDIIHRGQLDLYTPDTLWYYFTRS